MKISAVLITCDEEAKIARALESVAPVADEIIVVDSGSSDRTVEIASSFTDSVFVETWRGYRDQKQLATDRASHDWVLSLDADEALSPRLQAEISACKRQAAPVKAGFRVARLSRFLGSWIRHTTWYPDYQLRLFDRTRGRWEGGRVHESFQVDGPVGTLHHPLWHYSYSSVSEYLLQLENFSTLAAADLFESGRSASMLSLATSPALAFVRNYFLRLGILDRTPGLAVSVMAATSTFFKLLKLRELHQEAASADPEDADRADTLRR